MKRPGLADIIEAPAVSGVHLLALANTAASATNEAVGATTNFVEIYAAADAIFAAGATSVAAIAACATPVAGGNAVDGIVFVPAKTQSVRLKVTPGQFVAGILLDEATGVRGVVSELPDVAAT